MVGLKNGRGQCSEYKEVTCMEAGSTNIDWGCVSSEKYKARNQVKEAFARRPSNQPSIGIGGPVLPRGRLLKVLSGSRVNVP